MKRAPTSADWIYELKQDGYRLMVRRDGDRVRIYSRRGADFTLRFPRIVEAVRRLKVKSILLDGEGIVYDQNGMPSFDLIHSKQYDREVSLVAFDLLELEGDEVAPAAAARPQGAAGEAVCQGSGRHRVWRAHRGRRRGHLPDCLQPGATRAWWRSGPHRVQIGSNGRYQQQLSLALDPTFQLCRPVPLRT